MLEQPKEEIKLRKIISTIQRSRLSKKQLEIFNHGSDQHCVNLTNAKIIKFDTIIQLFGNSNKLILDIGFGNGEQLFELAKNLPNYNFIGVELYKKGIVNLINKLNQYQICNVKIIFGDVKEVIHKFDNKLIYKLQIFFPDPWPKLRHHKRRLIEPNLIKTIKDKLEDYGILHIITDSSDYADNIIKNVSLVPNFNKINNHQMFRPITKFEKIAKDLGNSISELVFVLNSDTVEN